MSKHPLLDLVDVFGSVPLKGNPLAVVRGAEGLSGEEMLKLTRWLGFSETTFLLPPADPAADYRVRIFYPGGELPFAGHPTLGTCHAWLAGSGPEAGGTPRREGMVVQECGAGLVEVRQEEGMLSFCAPPLARGGELTAEERAEAARIAGVEESAILSAVHADNGPGWKMLRLRSAEDVLAASPLPRAPVPTDIGLVGPSPAGSDTAWEIRAFFANDKGMLVEDPVTGSFNAAAAMYLFGTGLARGSYVAAQGRKVGADGRVFCRVDKNNAVWIGGKVVTISSGGIVDAGDWG
ncbi:MAG TPA: PhzF family phenazine biosynthesis protein [Sphingomonadaceae bacterium]|nr:PhzF family phenazine biosynthesis protein [Sphingomonadaceae bacterium]